MPRIIAISDTHGRHDQLVLPEGDILAHTGDFTNVGGWGEFADFVDWFASQPHEHKVFTCGNHDKICEAKLAKCRAYVPAGLNFLVDEAATIEGLKFYGSPWTPKFFNWSYMRERGARLDVLWDMIPEDTDVLMTHGPPYGHGDKTFRGPVVGCIDLLQRVREVGPKLHIFGHIHEGYGITTSDGVPNTSFVNASTCTIRHEPTNPPIVLDVIA